MAIPPIISNAPLFKALKADAPDRAQEPDALDDAVKIRDKIEVSETLQDRVGDVKTLSGSEARDAARQAAQILENSDFALGLDPNFDR